MPALPPKADMNHHRRDVRSVPSKLMSGAAGAIAATNPALIHASRITTLLHLSG